jgi:hypothetical protein
MYNHRTNALDLGYGQNSKRDQAYPFRLWTLYSAFVTLIKRSSSLMGIQLVRVFIEFSKSESSRMSLIPSINAADVAWSTSRVVPKFADSDFSDGMEN